MGIIRQFIVAALVLGSLFAAEALVEIASAYDLGGFILCLIFTGLATVTLWGMFPTSNR